MILASHISVELAAGDDKPAPAQWVQVLPIGRAFGRDGRGPYVLAAEDVPAVIEATRRYAGKVQLPIDYEHAIDVAPKGTRTPAAGWITALQQRPDGLYARVEWTPTALQHLKAREYRYLSPVFHHDADGRVVRLLRAALTQKPNLDLKAVANMEGAMDEPLAELRRLLELPEDAGIEATLEKVRVLLESRQSAEPDPTRYVPIGEFERVVADLHRRDAAGVSLQAAEEIVTGAIGGGELPPYLREWAVALCTVDRAAFDRFLERTAGSVGRIFQTSIASRRPPADRAPSLDDDQAAVARALGHSAEDFHKYGRS